MATSSVVTDGRCGVDVVSEEIAMGSLQLNELEAASWGGSWQPRPRDRREWPEIPEWPPPDEAPDLCWVVEPLDAYGEDVRRLRRLLVGD
jgi:hypothetical protein